jgi:hypothetical protein
MTFLLFNPLFMTLNIHKSALISLLMTVTSIQLLAQKLPAIQKERMRAPANVKIDGKLAEWGTPLKAYNHSNDIFYSIANDDANLYLVIQAKDVIAAKKIIGGGITLTLNSTGKNDTKEAATIMFPNTALTAKSQIGYLISEPPMANDVPGKQRQIDSLVSLMNTVISVAAKEIKVTGIESIGDTLLSVYNQTGIKTGIRFDNQRALCYELAIPLKYLDFLNVKKEKFYYQVMLNGLNAGLTSSVFKTAQGPVTVTAIPRSISGGNYDVNQAINFPTDFWGEYSLVR